MIIELERYNEVGELLIGNRTTRSQVQVIYQNGVREALVTMAAVHMGVEVMGMRKWHGHIQSASKSGSRIGMHTGTVE